MNRPARHPVVKAFAVLYDVVGDHHLVWRGQDPATGRAFHRLLGGHVELGETSREAVVREIAEEVGADLAHPRLLGVLEEIFTYDGGPGHEVVFVYDAPPVEVGIGPAGGWRHEADGARIRVEWRSVTDPPRDVPLYPDGTADLMATTPAILAS